MGHYLPVWGYDDPFIVSSADYLFDNSIRFFAESWVDDPYAAGCDLLFPATAGFPAIKDNSDVMTFYLFIFDELKNEALPLLVQVIMINTDQVVAVYDDSWNVLIPSFMLYVLKKVMLL